MTDPDILRGIKAMVALQMATLRLARSRESVQDHDVPWAEISAALLDGECFLLGVVGPEHEPKPTGWPDTLSTRAKRAIKNSNGKLTMEAVRAGGRDFIIRLAVPNCGHATASELLLAADAPLHLSL